MAKLDVDAYREMYMKEVEENLMAKKDEIDNFTTENLHRAIMTELNRADEDTWEIEVPDDRKKAICDAENRCLKFMKTHKDIGIGKTF
jgi:hypothetical protein